MATQSSRGAKSGRPRAKATERPRAARGSTLSKGITRVDHDISRTHGYFVRIGYQRKRPAASRPRYVKFFGDASYGSKRRAREAAETWAEKTREADRRAQRAAAARAASPPPSSAAEKRVRRS